MHPKETLAILEELKNLGFSDEDFGRLHHFRRRGVIERISAFSRYCNRVSYFLPNGSNERVHRRLKYVLDSYRSGTSKDFSTLAEEAFADI